MGIYVVNRSVLEMIPAGQKYGFDNLMADFLGGGRCVHVERFRGYWLDIGRTDDTCRRSTNSNKCARACFVMANEILVTGASGFVGRRLVAALRARGETVHEFSEQE